MNDAAKTASKKSRAPLKAGCDASGARADLQRLAAAIERLRKMAR